MTSEMKLKTKQDQHKLKEKGEANSDQAMVRNTGFNCV